LNWFRTSLSLSGYPIKKAQKHLQTIDTEIEFNVGAYLNQQKWAIAKHHLANNPFYKTFNKHNVFKSWQDLPILEKSDLQIPLEKRLSDGYSLKNVYKNATSGSSGQPFRFAKDKHAHALTWANISNFYAQFGVSPGQSLEARFYGTPKSGMAQKKEQLKDKLAYRVRFDVLDLSEYNLEQFLHLFRRKKFVFINGYTSSIVRFAKYLKSKNTILKDVCPTLKICICTSEMLFENDKTLLETQFGIPIVNEYGAAELGIIAFENTEAIWELNSKTLFVEIVDDDGKAVGYDKEGNIVVTSLYNKAHPFIRYKIGDLGVISKDKQTAKPILKKLTGRTNDFAFLPSGKIVPALTFYYITKTAVDKEGAIKELIVEQKDKSTFNLIYVSTSELDALQKKRILNAIETYLEPGLLLNFIKTEHIERSKSGKLKQFVSRLKKT
jgi:phenylacetate-CoA ligase